MSNPHRRKLEREAKKRNLMLQSQKRLITHPAPDFGAKEGDILDLKQKVQQLVVANNNLAAEMDHIKKNRVVERMNETYYMLAVLLRSLCEATAFPITTEADVREKTRLAQLRDVGLEDKGPGATVEVNDTIIMTFQLFEGDQLVDDQTKQDMAYKVGSKILPCEDGMVGMQVGESRFFEVVFGQGLTREDLVGKNLRMLLLCKGIKKDRRP